MINYYEELIRSNLTCIQIRKYLGQASKALRILNAVLMLKGSIK